MNTKNTLRTTYLFALAAALLAAAPEASATYCNNGATNYPKCDNNAPPPPPPPPAPASPSKVDITNKNTTAANAASTAAARLQANLKNQQQQAQQQAQQQSLQGSQSLDNAGNSSNTIGGDSHRSSMWVLPAPVFTPPLPPIADCPGANVKQMAIAGFWNGFSYADAGVNTDNCTAIILYNQYVATCKWKSAQQVLDLLSQRVLPGFTPSNLELLDLDKQQCDALLNPPLQPSQPATVNYISNYYQDSPKEKPTKKKAVSTGPCEKPGWKRNSKGICYKPCPCTNKKVAPASSTPPKT